MTKKLLDDCFLHDKDRLRHDAAVTLLKSRITPITDAEIVAIDDASGRILVDAAAALRPVPAHTNSAVDGYAVSSQHYDVNTGGRFAVSARAAAGRPLDASPPSDTAVRIFTGAAIPEHFDTVVMQEDCTVETGADGGVLHVVIPGGLKKGANVRRVGEDVAAGEVLFGPGTLLRPQDVAALASIGVANVNCHGRVRVAIVSSGDEVIRAGSRALNPGEVFDANAPMLNALARITGADVSDLGVWPDDATEIERRLADAAQRFDLILTSGGASRGEEDHMLGALDALGRRHMWQLAVKPGRPLMFGQIGDTIMVGLPGNPVAVFVCYLMYVYPMLRRLGGGHWPEPRRFTLPAAFEMPKRKTGRREFLRGFYVTGADGQMAVDKYPRDGSGLISGLRAAQGLIDIGEDVTGVAKGDPVAFIPFTEFGILDA
ncbi:MAG: molybdopterin molybdotransferase MoeA [Hyphomicrobiaceae bacterium]|nr:molybdopterin molybdotransferase MoeA [Hyphomicrobiaceae bacterium]